MFRHLCMSPNSPVSRMKHCTETIKIRDKYSNGDYYLNTGQVRIPNGPNMTGCWMVWFLNSGLKTGQIMSVLCKHERTQINCFLTFKYEKFVGQIMKGLDLGHVIKLTLHLQPIYEEMRQATNPSNRVWQPRERRRKKQNHFEWRI